MYCRYTGRKLGLGREMLEVEELRIHSTTVLGGNLYGWLKLRGRARRGDNGY